MDKVSSDRTILKNCLESLDIGKLAEESDWRSRSRKVSALNWCMALCLVSTHKAPSLSLAAHFMGLINRLTATRQALHKRLHKGGGRLIERAATKAHCRRSDTIRGFKRVFVQDSTCFKLPKSLEKHYSGSRNQCASSAVMRIQANYDMASNRFVEFALSGFGRNDRAAGQDILEHIDENDLALRDLVHYKIKDFAFDLMRGKLSAHPKTGGRHGAALQNHIDQGRTHRA